MPESRLSALITVEDWAEELQTILSEVDDAVQSGELEQRSKAQELLLDYIKASPSAAESLDKIASQASLDLLQAQVDDVVAAIAARNAELKAATKLIQQSAAEAKSSKKALQFEKVVDTLKTAREGIDAFKRVSGAVAEGDAQLTEKLTEIAKAIADFEKLASKLTRETGASTRGARSRSAKPAARSSARKARKPKKKTGKKSKRTTAKRSTAKRTTAKRATTKRK